MREQIREIKEEDLKHIKDVLNYALDGPARNHNEQTHFNTFANAIELVDTVLNSHSDQTSSLMIAILESQLNIEKVHLQNCYTDFIEIHEAVITELERQLKELKG